MSFACFAMLREKMGTYMQLSFSRQYRNVVHPTTLTDNWLGIYQGILIKDRLQHGTA